MVYNREQQIDDAFFALSHPTRRGVLDQLATGNLSVAAVSEPHNLSAAQMTKHLAILERGGLLNRDKQGRTHVLSLEPAALKEVMQWVRRYQQFWDQRLDALDHFLTNQN